MKGEGNIDFREFSNWYKELLGEKPAAGPSSVPKVPKEYKKNADFKALFIKHCSFGKGNKWWRCWTGSLREVLEALQPDHTQTDHHICGYSLHEVERERAEDDQVGPIPGSACTLCGALGKTFEEVADAVMEAGPPKKG